MNYLLTNQRLWVDDAAALSVRRQLSAAPAPSGAGELSYLHTDHLGSSSTTTDASGNVTARQSYYPYGGVRQQVGTLPTRRTYTGQYADDTGLMFYNARYYAPALGRFISADSIVPDSDYPQGFNRYMYTLGNPVRYSDPTGHLTDDQIKDWTGCDVKCWESSNLSWLSILRYLNLGDTVSAFDPGTNLLSYLGEATLANGSLIFQTHKSTSNIYELVNMGLQNLSFTRSIPNGSSRRSENYYNGRAGGWQNNLQLVGSTRVDETTESERALLVVQESVVTTAASTAILTGLGCIAGSFVAGTKGCSAGGAAGFILGALVGIHIDLGFDKLDYFSGPGTETGDQTITYTFNGSQVTYVVRDGHIISISK